MYWITTGQLDIWARARVSETQLPGLVSDLIRATSPDFTAIRFPTGEKGQVRGFDGNLESVVEALNVPEGRSLWEFGTEDDYKGKALKDFKKRSAEVSVTEQADTTLVFVTPFTWDTSKADGKIENWISERMNEANWKDVRFIDGVQLESWLAECPAVAAWHAKNTLKVAPRDGVRSTDEYWEDFGNRFKPRITESVLLCDREKAVDQLLTVLTGAPQQFVMIADSPDEVIAFAIAAIRSSNSEMRLHLEARTLVVDTMTAGRELVGREGLVLLLRGEAARSPGQFASAAPTLVPLGRQQRVGNGVVLERPSGFAMGQAMMTMGYSLSQAETLARGAGRSLAALARQIPGGAIDEPPWMPSAELLLPSILAGSWDAANAMDKEVVRDLSGREDYNEYEKQLRRFTNDNDPPLDREGTAWKVRAPMDAFIHVGHLIGPEDLERLHPILTKVFSFVAASPDPNDEVVFSPRRASTYSEWLREGLATTLLLIGVWEKQGRLDLQPGEGQAFANKVVAELPGLGTNARLLISLKNELPLLAEAAPDPLLEALERMLEGKGEAIRPIFDETGGDFLPRSHHTGVLWALETLAWDPVYFRRACLVLAKLAAIDPGGRLSNRPLASLSEIFLPWHPGTNATEATRLAVLDEIVRKLPEVGWELLLTLLPESHSISSGTARPRLREGATAPQVPVTYAALWKAQGEIIQRTIASASAAYQVTALVRPLTAFPSDARSRALEVVDQALHEANAADRQQIWLALREEVRRHERFASTQWALSGPDIAEMRALVDKYSPSDPTLIYSELFDRWSLGINDDTGNEARKQAVRDLFEKFGPKELLRFAHQTSASYSVLEAIQTADFPPDDLAALFEHSYANEPTDRLTISLSGIFRRKVGKENAAAWLANRLPLSDSQSIAAQLWSWPVSQSTWSVARRLGPDVMNAYWRGLQPHWINGSRRLLILVIARLLQHHRADAALRTMSNRLAEVPSELIFRTLDLLVSELIQSGEFDAMIGYELEQVFKALDDRKDIDATAIAAREYPLLALLEHEDRRLKLHDIMAADPEFFHQVLRDVYRAEGEESTEGDQGDRARWRQAYSLLNKFSTVPGYAKGAPDRDALFAWIERVRELGVDYKRAEITESSIGRILAHAPADDKDGGWPHRFVRDAIEQSDGDALRHGLQIERYNMRGVTMRGLYDGGEQERQLSVENKEYAAKAAAWPRTSALLTSIADYWDRDAAREDLEASKRRLRS